MVEFYGDSFLRLHWLLKREVVEEEHLAGPVVVLVLPVDGEKIASDFAAAAGDLFVQPAQKVFAAFLLPPLRHFLPCSFYSFYSLVAAL